MNSRAKGRRNELRAKKILENAGYEVEIARPARMYQKQNDLWGLWDLVAIRKGDIRCVQVKSNNWPSSVEMEAMALWECPSYVTKEVWRFNDREKEPVIRVL